MNWLENIKHVWGRQKPPRAYPKTSPLKEKVTSNTDDNNLKNKPDFSLVIGFSNSHLAY